MSLVKTANPIIDISGSVGGSVFSRDASGLHLVSPHRSVHKASPPQTRRRRAFITATRAWHQASAAGHAQLWKLYAGRHPGRNRIGETIIYTGYQIFMRFNIYRAYNNVACILLPPEG
ncbi:hypothetical protein ES703_117909 [subsurface metagenome]